MIKNVIFDLDGTLLNTLEDLAIATNYALKQLKKYVNLLAMESQNSLSAQFQMGKIILILKNV